MREHNILKPIQIEALKIVSSEKKLNNFYLSGGTALSAFYLHHRFSEDLDFFSELDFDMLFIHSFMDSMKESLEAREVHYEHVFDRNIFFLQLTKDEQLKIEFTKYPFKQLGKCLNKSGMAVDSLKDIAANKLMTLLDRFDPKDFVDIFFLLQRLSLASVKQDTEKKFGVKISDILLGSEFAKVQRVQALPIMLKPLSLEELKIFFMKKARAIGRKVIVE